MRDNALILCLFCSACSRFGFGLDGLSDAQLTDTRAARDALVDRRSSVEPADSNTGDDQLPDAPEIALPCTSDENTLALYNLDLDFADATDQHAAGVATGSVTFAEGSPACGGQGAHFAAGGFVAIPDDPLWDTIRSFDFWMKPAIVGSAGFGVIARDGALTPTTGHVMVAYDNAGRVSVRLQYEGESFTCSDNPVAIDHWVHVGVNVGPTALELFLDGVRQNGTGTTRMGGYGVSLFTCGQSDASRLSLAGNDNPWVIGGASSWSTEGTADNVQQLYRGAIDGLRLSSVPRDFAAMFR